MALTKALKIFSGVGKNRSLIQPRWVASHQNATKSTTVTTLITTLLPSPGRL